MLIFVLIFPIIGKIFAVSELDNNNNGIDAESGQTAMEMNIVTWGSYMYLRICVDHPI